jgi:tetratricopeptide (TPR) repeat protein
VISLRTTRGGGTLSTRVTELAESIKEKGRRSTTELPPLLKQAECLAEDMHLNAISRALAHRAAANAHQLLNEFEPALLGYDRAIAILENLDEPTELGRTLHAKVGLLNFMCRFDELLVCADRARSIFEALNDRHRLARLDANLSHAYHRLNRFDLVLRFAERAMPALDVAGDQEGYFAALTNSAAALTLMNDFEEAERRYVRALEIAEKMGLSVWVLSCRYNLAFLLYLRGNSAEALTEIHLLRSSYEGAGDRRQVCQCFLNEAEILLEIGDVEGAIEAACGAEGLARSLGLNLETGKSLFFQAVAARRLNGSSDSGPFLGEATRCFQQERNDVWTAVAKLQVALVRGEWGDGEALAEAMTARALLQDSGLPNRLALADVVIGRIRKARGDGEGSLEAFRSALSESRQGRSEWMQFHAAHQLGTLLVPTEPAEALQHLLTAEKRLDSLWSRLGSDDLKIAFLNDRENVYTPLVRLASEQSPQSALELSERARSRVLRERLGSLAMDAGALASSLSTNEIVVEYFVADPDLFVFTITREGVECRRQENAIPELQALIENFERHIKSCSVSWEQLAAARKHQRLTAETHLRELYRILIEPIASRLRRRVVVVPHGLLHRVPFPALWTGSRYLIDDHEVAYSPSADLYCRPAPASGSDSAVFIAFSGAQKTTAEDEVREAAAKVPGSLVFVDPSMPEFTEVFKTPHALVHIAGHAGIDTIGGRLSWIETAQGRLTNRDLSNLSIRANTIVITGCQTARRSILPGDEWQGLMRSFYLAGASAVVSALWDIRDESARRFSSGFYDRFLHTDVLTAGQAGMQSARGWQDHPYFWAGFSAFIRNDVRRTCD